MSIGTLTWADSAYEVALDKLKKEIDHGPVTENEVEMSSKLGILPRAMTDQDWHALSQSQTGQSLYPSYKVYDKNYYHDTGEGHVTYYPRHSLTNPQDRDPYTWYDEPGLKQVSPAAELFGLGLGKTAVNTLTKSKMYSDQVVDRFTRMITPNTRYHGGPSNLSTLRTPYDRAMQGEAMESVNRGLTNPTPSVTHTYADTQRAGYSPFQAATYTASKEEASGYAKKPSNFRNQMRLEPLTGPRSLYEVDTSTAKKVFNFSRPSRSIMKELDK